MKKYFGNSVSIKVNVAQLLLLWILFPVAYGILYIIKPDSTAATDGLIWDLVGGIELLEVAIAIIKERVLFDTSSMADITVAVLLKAFPDAVLVGVVAHFVNQVWDIWMSKIKNVEAMTILPTFVGIALSSFVVTALSHLGDIISMITEFGVIIIMLIGFKIMFRGRFSSKIFSFKKILVLFIDGLYAVILVCFVASMMVASFSEPALPLWDSLKLIFTSLICMTVASVVVFFVRRSAKKDNSVF